MHTRVGQMIIQISNDKMNVKKKMKYLFVLSFSYYKETM
jgi:hypothetical protein